MINRQIGRWWNVVAGALAGTVSAGTIAVFTFGVFIKPISADYGWTRGEVTYSHGVFTLASGIGHLMLGSIMNRWGVRPPSIIFVAIFSLSIMAVPFLPPSLILFYAIFAVMGYFGAAATAMPYAAAITAWFDTKRGLALGLTIAGSGFGGPLMAFLANYLLVHYGWRAGYTGVGALAGIIGLFGLIFLVRMPPSYNTATARKERETGVGVPTLWSVFTGSKTFWLISIALFSASMTSGIQGSIIPLLTDHGVSNTSAVTMLSVYGITSMMSGLIIGFSIDRIFLPYVAATTFVVGIIGLLLVWLGLSNIAIYVGMVCLGLYVGPTHTFMSVVVGRYFSPRAYSKVLGAVWISTNVGVSGGNFVAGLTYDLTKSYDIAIWSCIALAAISIVAVLRLGPYAFTPGAVSAEKLTTEVATADMPV